ncbi:MAG: sensor histidine kinase N-terminal domain-containing protein [Burkholderiales bacterium]|nr:sensor histidine kinase N-terminal domain-containing protein [Burkholderiales bacterium]
MAERPHSLRGRLLALLLAGFALAWAAVAVTSVLDARHEIGELFDAQLVESAQLLLAQVRHEPDELEVEDRPLGHRYQRALVFQVSDRRGRVVLRSAGAPSEALGGRGEGFGAQVAAGERWRTYALVDERHRVRVVVGERADVRAALARRIALGMLTPLAYALPAFGLLIWVGVGRSLRPLDRLAREVEGRAAENLAEVEARGAPREVVPLVGALNRLFARVREAFEKERRFTDDAAHELRTPLAAIKTHAQVALAAREAAERDRALASIVQGADRTAHLAGQLLTLARVEAGAGPAESAPVHLRRAAADAVAELAPWALDKGVEVALEDGPDATVRGNAALLDVMLRNLVDNAIRYTPAGGAVRVRVRFENGRPSCEVEDTGPGIPADERARVLERFYRVLGSAEEGSGLGFSIVRRVAERHGASLHLADGAGGKGLRVRVEFGPDRA